MIEFIKPANLNGAELREELASAGIIVNDDANSFSVTGEILSLNIEIKDKSIAEEIINAHNGTVIAPEPTVADKLASVGLSLDDLKTALGLA